MNLLFLSSKTQGVYIQYCESRQRGVFCPDTFQRNQPELYIPMKYYSLPVFLYFFLVFSFITPSSLLAATQLPSQHIALSFDITHHTIFGNSTFSVPADTELLLSFQGLENIVFTETTAQKNVPIPITAQKTVRVHPQNHKKMFSASWQLALAPAHPGASNTIEKNGIALTGRWHPTADQDMMFTLRARLPKGFSGITEANTLTTTPYQGYRLLTANAPQPLQSITFVAGPYTIRSRQAGKITIYSYFFREDAHLARNYLAKAADYIQRYEKRIGPFPYKRYSIVENRQPTGYGMPGFTLLGQAVIRLPFIKETSLGHEILHSWFGNALRTDGTGNWCEGLTTALADQSYAAAKNQGQLYRKKQTIRYQAHVHPGNLTTLLDFHSSSDTQPMAGKLRAIGYDKGSMFFHMLRNLVGDNHFFLALKTLYKNNKFQKIGWDDIETAFCEATGEDLTRFFGQWLLRSDIPEIAIQEAGIGWQDGRNTASFTVTQANKNPYLLKIPVLIHTLLGTTRTDITVAERQEQITVPVDSLPISIELDPDNDILRMLKTNELPPVWERFTGAAHKTVLLPPKDQLDIFLPLMAKLQRMGCVLRSSSEVTNADFTRGSFLFLGDFRQSRSLFGPLTHPATGFTLEVRNNPLAPGQVMVLVSSGSAAETGKIIRKLNHYGSASYLHFQSGILKKQFTTPAENGIRQQILTPASGIPVAKTLPLPQIVDRLSHSRVVYIGETHTDYGAHLLQLQIIQALHARNRELMIGMEMFPRSAQSALDAYIAGEIATEQEFLQRSQYFSAWGYDYRLYRDIIGFARAHHIPVKGLNLEKKIVSTVFKDGTTDTIPQAQLQQVAAERDLTLPGYQQRLRTIHAAHAASPHGGTFAGFLQAQAIWDETMAESIVDALEKNPDTTMIVLAGTGHVYKDSSIPPRVARRMQLTQAVLIANTGLDTGTTLGQHADYLMFTPQVELPPAGKIGVMLSETSPEDDTPKRVTITSVNAQGKGRAAGLKPGDIILELDDIPVTAIGTIKALLMGRQPGEMIKLTIQRGKTKTSRVFPVELSNMEQTMLMPPGHPQK